ncbi:MAG: hypothetical protein AAF334_10305, partial [Pseudomonadota bacterium]
AAPGTPFNKSDSMRLSMSDLFILRDVPSFTRSDTGPECVAQTLKSVRSALMSDSFLRLHSLQPWHGPGADG